ncbi:Structural maintenance of chromosomes protein 5 [Chytriomyces hyalinus]|nr:Structural maintenance of chromosomes protein 5 [Chytriomyces hyalinus]
MALVDLKEEPASTPVRKRPATLSQAQFDNVMRKRKRNSAAFMNAFDRYLIGSIVQITLTNFVTYDYVQFSPGPNLNMVIGPNGTGKSTIVCAIALGLGGSPQILARANEVKDYVKKNKEKATIEIEVKTEDGTTVIERSFKTTAKSSTWKIDGHTTTEKNIREYIKKLNIQVDNLCQFLPQDKVASFAKMKPDELLRETERAVGGDELLPMHDKLIADGKELKAVEEVLATDTEALAVLEKKQSSQSELVEKLRERERRLHEATVLKMAIPLSEYDGLHAEYVEIKSEKKEAKLRLDAALTAVAPVSDIYGKLKRASQTAKTLVQKTGDWFNKEGLTKVTSAQELIAANEEQERSHGAHVRAAKKSLDEWVNKLDVARAKRDQSQREVDRIKADLDRAGLFDASGRRLDPEKSPEIQQIHERMTQIKDESENCHMEISGLNDQKHLLFDGMKRMEDRVLQLKHELGETASVANRKLQALQRLNETAFRAVQFLRSNHGLQFEKQVFEPICMGINASQPEYARALETFIGYNRLITFVTQTENDYKTLRDYLYDVKKLRVNVVCVQNIRNEFKSAISQAELDRLGFDGVLIDFVQGHPVYLSALMQYTGVHQTPICLRADRGFNYNQVDNHSNIQSYACGDYSYSVRGAYGSKSTKSEAMREAQILKLSVDVEKQDQLQREIQHAEGAVSQGKRDIDSLGAKENVLRARFEDLKRERAGLNERKREIMDRPKAYERKCVELEQYELRVSNVEEALEKSRGKLDELNSQKQRYAIDRAKLTMSYVKRHLELCDMLDQMIQTTVDRVQLEAEAGDASIVESRAKDQNTEIQNQYARITEKFAAVKARAETALRAAQAAVPENTSDAVREEVAAVKEKYTLEELLDQLTRVQARADILANTDPKVLEQFERRALEIEAAKAKIEKIQQTILKLKASIERIRAIWEGQLNELVTKINNQFSKSLQNIGCAGEIKIGKEEDFNKWRIDILVKFRDTEKLQILDDQRQSGGERSVTTITYLMALQQLSKAPFRVVDEINQGMDPRNERAVHSQMVEIACEAGSSQYFLITPKLLPDLEYHVNMKILTIYNGDYQPEKFDIEGFLAKKKQRMAES